MEARGSLNGTGVVRNGACGGVWSMTGGIVPAMVAAPGGGRVGVVAASLGGGARRVGRGILVDSKGGHTSIHRRGGRRRLTGRFHS
jgi:hypothetical protein